MIEPETLQLVDTLVANALAQDATDALLFINPTDSNRIEFGNRTMMQALSGRWGFSPGRRDAIIDEYNGGRLKLEVIVTIGDKRFVVVKRDSGGYTLEPASE
jgi:hypothetical protein